MQTNILINCMFGCSHPATQITRFCQPGRFFCLFDWISLGTKHNGSSLIACVFIGPALRTLCLWVDIVSPCLCFIYAWAGCLFIYTNKLCCNVSLGICSHFAFSSHLFFCSNCLLSPSSLVLLFVYMHVYIFIDFLTFFWATYIDLFISVVTVSI